MSKKDQPKQKTPKGLEIPIPKHKDVDDAIEKLAKSKPSLTPRRPKK
ncbi:MAG: hypothetical protein ABR978_08890 [Dehalococcoidia bacterium]|jgi:hypothetical protein